MLLPSALIVSRQNALRECDAIRNLDIAYAGSFKDIAALLRKLDRQLRFCYRHRRAGLGRSADRPLGGRRIAHVLRASLPHLAVFDSELLQRSELAEAACLENAKVAKVEDASGQPGREKPHVAMHLFLVELDRAGHAMSPFA